MKIRLKGSARSCLNQTAWLGTNTEIGLQSSRPCWSLAIGCARELRAYLNVYTLAVEQFQDRYRPHYANNNNNYKKSSARTHSTSSYAEKKETGEQQHQRRAPFCFKCKTEGHRIAECSEFKKMTAGERYKFVFKSNLCFSCFAPKHAAKKCNWSKPCPISGCKIIHHVLLHEDGAKGASTTAASNVEETNSSCTTVGFSQIAFGVTTIEVFAADGSIVH